MLRLPQGKGVATAAYHGDGIHRRDGSRTGAMKNFSATRQFINDRLQAKTFIPIDGRRGDRDPRETRAKLGAARDKYSYRER